MSGDSDPIEVVAYDQRWVGLFASPSENSGPCSLHSSSRSSTSAAPQSPASRRSQSSTPSRVRTLDDSSEIVAAVESLGYESVPEFEDELPDRRYFRRWANGRRSHQIHLVERSNTDWWDRHVRFRDWLRNHDDDRDRYAELKRKLASTYRNDRGAYTDGKSHFVRAIEEKSTPGHAQPSQHGS